MSRRGGVDVMAGHLRAKIGAFLTAEGIDKPGSIPPGMTFREWVEDLGRRGLKVDRKPFRLDNRPALVPIYDAIPVTREEAFGWTLVIQKATQLGLTVWEVLATIYMALAWGPVNIGLFLPDQATASFKSEHRFMPMIRSNTLLYDELIYRRETDGLRVRVGEGNVLTRQFNNSLMLFLWTSGKVSTESRPMDIVTLDEVQGMELDQIDKVRARMGDSEVNFALMLSTANVADLDINRWYKLGTQEEWHTRCPACGELSDLSDPVTNFPSKSIAYDLGEREYHWACPACSARIADPQIGEYVMKNPEASGTRVRSFLLPRTISPRITPREMFEGYSRAMTGNQKKSFYNRTLARPYIDADQVPVTLAHCEAGVVAGRAAGVTWQTEGRDTYMGIDQMGGWNAVIIKRRLPDGRQAVVHVEAVYGNDPFARCGDLMQAFGVAICVVEQLPNVNDARRFANLPAHRGRVFLAGYADLRDDMMVWGDTLSESDRRTAIDDRSRYTVTLNQYKAMQTALYRVRDNFCIFPDPALLEQDVIDRGMKKRILILRDWVFAHFTRTALVVTQDPNTRKPKAHVQKLGDDPHFAYANMLLDVGWSRAFGTSTMIMPYAQPGDPIGDTAALVLEKNPGLPTSVAAMMEKPREVCGQCRSFEGGLCKARNLRVAPPDPACLVFEPI